MTMMRAARVTAYGGPDVIEFVEIPRPVPRAGEVLVRVIAAPVTSGDMRMRSGKVPRGMQMLLRLAIGWNGPRNPVPGWGYVGEVVAGEGLASGTIVAGLAGFKGGAHAEYLRAPTKGPILPLPPGLDPVRVAGTLFGGLTAAHFLLDRAKVRRGDRVWINGATGGVGAAAVRLARHLGAEVTATASAARAELAAELGAHHFHPYSAGLPTGLFDVVVDVFGNAPFSVARPLLAPDARHVAVTATLADSWAAALRPNVGTHRRVAGTNRDDRASLARFLDLVATGALPPIPVTVFPFAQLRAAHALAETMHKPGALVVSM
ncbi:MAG: zinc-binding dehydrogenase [Pseudomonadota bacterium]